MLLGLLLGNTSLRYGTFDPRGAADVSSSGHVSWEDLASRQAELASLAAAGDVRGVVVGSVRDDLLGSVARLLPRTLPEPVVARRDFAIPIENRYADPEEVGTDRLLNAVAAAERAGPRGAVVLDAGTALSISVVSPDGAFLGGSIAAGLPAMAAGLAVSTPRLPGFERGADEPIVATGTAAALRAGVYWQTIGGVSRLLKQTLDELPFRSPRVFATGGDAAWIAAAVPEIDEVIPLLTFEGLIAAYRQSDRPES